MTDKSVVPSYVCGTGQQPLLYWTVGETLCRAADRWPDREALVVCHQGARFTYRELDREVSRLASGLLALGLQPGDRVGIWSPNRLEWVLTQFATARAGLILGNINPAYRLSELTYALTTVGCRMLLVAAAFKSSDYLQMLRSLLPLGALLADGR